MLSFSLKYLMLFLPSTATLPLLTKTELINSSVKHIVENFSQLFDFDILTQTPDKRLFNSIKYPDHCLNFLLPQKRSHSRQLRPKGHDYTLSHIQTTMFKNYFLNRCLFSTLCTVSRKKVSPLKILQYHEENFTELNIILLKDSHMNFKQWCVKFLQNTP